MMMTHTIPWGIVYFFTTSISTVCPKPKPDHDHVKVHCPEFTRAICLVVFYDGPCEGDEGSVVLISSLG